jgi:hypothetical protein
MNQRIIIYIILSAILLYLYYRRRDITIFAAFMVVVGSTLIFGDTREGLNVGSIGGGGGGGDKECVKLGLKPIKLDKNDLPGGLEKVYKIIKSVVEKHFPYDDEFQKFMSELNKEVPNIKKDDLTLMGMFIQNSVNFYFQGKRDIIDNPDLDKIISGGKVLLKFLEKLSKSSELDSNIKKIAKNSICLCKYCINIYKEVQKPTGDGGGDNGGDKGDKGDKGEDGDEEEKPKKKPNKKPKKKQEEDTADGE